MTTPQNPLEDKNEIINAINREGIFFRKAVLTKFEELSWKCEVEYPYSLQKFLEEKRASKSIDIFANRRFGNPDNVEIKLIIECKRSYGPKNKWIFFKYKDDAFYTWKTEIPQGSGCLFDYFSRFSQKKFPICYDQIVLKQSNKSQGENLSPDLKRDGTQIYQASAEVAHALYGIQSNYTEIFNKIGSDLWQHYFRHVFRNYWFLPIVVTNAEMFVSEFKISKNTLEDGNIKEKDFNLSSLPWLVYEYPLPHYLQIQEDQNYNDNRPFNDSQYIRKMPIIFLNSMKIKDFLKIIYSSAAPHLFSLGKIK